MVKYFILAFLCLILVTASDPFFGTDLTWEKVPEESMDDVKEKPWMSPRSFRPYLTDSENRVSDAFKISPYYYSSVNFWFMIYTQFESSSVVIHDKSNLSLIYKVLDFSSLHKKGLHRNTLYILQDKIADEKIDLLKKEFDVLIKDPFSLAGSSKKIYGLLRRAQMKIPLNAKERISFFRELRGNLRTQTGQKNYIRDGIKRSLPYENFLKKYFTAKKLPTELLSIPFLESSFNPKAHSKVNALGVWQFMPFIAGAFVPKRTIKTDYRSNVGTISIAAAFLMSENYRIMKSWDLAVTAYNSGTKHLLKTKRELASDDINLEDVIKHSDSEHFGFASKNFFSEFLALAHTLAYKDELFDDLHDHERKDAEKELGFFMAKCSVRLHKELSNEQLDDVEFHNHQLKDTKMILPRGYILTTKGTLPSRKFHRLAFNDLVKYKPKDWDRLLRRQSCSTR